MSNDIPEIEQMKSTLVVYFELFDSLVNFSRLTANEYYVDYSRLVESMKLMKSGDKVIVDDDETEVNKYTYYRSFLACHGVSRILSNLLRGELRENDTVDYYEVIRLIESADIPDDFAEMCYSVLDRIKRSIATSVGKEAITLIEEEVIPWSDKPDIDQEWTFERVFKEACPPGWEALFKTNQAIAAASKNDRLIRDRFKGESVPLKCDLLKAFELTPLDRVKVVIIGQDPYHTVVNGIPQATGLSFSTRKDAELQPSIRNIYTELANTVSGWNRPKHGDLTEWALRGVLLLNTCLTTSPGIPGAHKSIWKGVINQCICLIKEKRPDTVFILWGGHAQTIAKLLGKLHYIQGGHPSPLNRKADFIGGDYFNKANEHLKSRNIAPIDWSLTD